MANLDMSYCNGGDCELKGDCDRYMNNHPELNGEKWISIILVENTENCEYFINNNQ